MNQTTCPLCDGRDLGPSWLKLWYNGKDFHYLECSGCGSLICDPMPDDETLRKMYDISYVEPGGDTGEFDTPGKFAEVVELLKTLEPGIFIDFGCGEGKLLREVKSLGWRAVGIDFNPEFAEVVRAEGIEIRGIHEALDFQADVVHLGDVIEHLADLNTQFPKILNLLKPGGLLVAHGPLEGNPNLFYRFIRLGKRLRGNPSSAMAPFHVILATTEGQIRLFERAGLREVDYRVTEIAFPAPDSLARSDLGDPRMLAMYSIRKISQAATRLGGKKLGNRHFYVGRKPAGNEG